MDVHISLDGRGELAGQIYRQIRDAILAGRLRPGQTVPSTRELAARIEVSRNTTSTAYDRLVAEGFLTARPGVRTYVSDRVGPRDTGRERSPNGHGDGHASLSVPGAPRPVWRTQPEPVVMSAVLDGFDFRAGMPDARRFPFARWRSLVANELRHSAIGTGGYADPSGHPGLRAALARHVGVSRGVSATPESILVTNGTQQAVDLVGRVLVEPGDVAVVEDPGWLPPRTLFRTLGARLVMVPVDDEGLIVEALPERARLVYVSPSHQFPLGVCMSLPRRLALLDWARRAGAVVVEDDYDSEFRYTGRPLDPLHNLDDTGRVIYLGTFSKTMLPMLRLGFCVSPPWLHDALRRAKYAMDWHTSLPMQAALASFIDMGLLARHVRRMRRVYHARRDRIATVVDRDLGTHLALVPSAAGLHLTARLRDETAPDVRLVAHARDSGVHLIALSEFYERQPRPGLIFGLGAIDDDQIDEALRRLLRCLRPAPVLVP